MANRWENNGNGVRLYFCALQNQGRMNLDNILKSRDITLSTRIHLVKAMAFPVVMYGCKSWTIKKAECRRIDVLNCGVGEDF